MTSCARVRGRWRFRRPRSSHISCATEIQKVREPMKRKPSRKVLESLCGEPGPDDGLDPREFFKPAKSRRNSRKDFQLCRQVSETLNYVLSGECRDEILQRLCVCDVQPQPDATRLLVTVCPVINDVDFDPVLAIERLQHSIGWLRSEIARSISRRKVPELAFHVVVNANSAQQQGDSK